MGSVTVTLDVGQGQPVSQRGLSKEHTNQVLLSLLTGSKKEVENV